MPNLGWMVKQAKREFRGSAGRIVFFTLCLAVGVAAVVAVAGLSHSMNRGIRSEAKRLLAADLKVRSRGEMPYDIVENAIAEALPPGEVTRVQEMVTIVAAPGDSGGDSAGSSAGDSSESATVAGASALVELKVIAGRYPFYGELELSPSKPLSELIDDESVVVAPDLLSRLSLSVGDTLRIGGVGFLIAGEVIDEPDRVTFSIVLGPRVFMTRGGLERAGLVQFGSRVRRYLLIGLDGNLTQEAVVAAGERLSEALEHQPNLRVETYVDAQPSVRRGLDRMTTYLGLVALLSLLVGGIGVAQTVRAWLASRMDAIAVLKCLGVRPREVLALYVGQTAGFALVGSAIGVAAGIAAQVIAPRVLGDLLPARLVDPWDFSAVTRGIVLGVGVALTFSVQPLLAAARVPAMRVLRRNAEPLPPAWTARCFTALIIVAGVWAAATWQANSWRLGGMFTVGLGVTVAILAAAAKLTTTWVAAAPRRFAAIWLRHGFASLARPGAGAAGAIVALGIGVTVVLAMHLVEKHLSEELDADLPAHAPNVFLVDIQPDQWPAVHDTLVAQQADEIEAMPVITARLLAVDGVDVETLAQQSEDYRRSRWALTREQRVTYGADLPIGSEVIEGQWFEAPGPAEISIEEDFAEEIGARLGTVLTFDVQGVTMPLTVTSLRRVNWRTFRVNFFLHANAGVLDDAPQMRVAAARVPTEMQQHTQDLLAATTPNVTMIRTGEILEKVFAMLSKLGMAIKILGGFTVAAGIAILIGAVGSSAARRGREVAILKTLGMTRWGVIRVFGVEYALIGLIAGIVGAGAASAFAWGVMRFGFEADWRFMPGSVAVSIALAVTLTVVAGLAASVRALRQRPVEALRHE